MSPRGDIIGVILKFCAWRRRRASLPLARAHTHIHAYICAMLVDSLHTSPASIVSLIIGLQTRLPAHAAAQLYPVTNPHDGPAYVIRLPLKPAVRNVSSALRPAAAPRSASLQTPAARLLARPRADPASAKAPAAAPSQAMKLGTQVGALTQSVAKPHTAATAPNPRLADKSAPPSYRYVVLAVLCLQSVLCAILLLWMRVQAWGAEAAGFSSEPTISTRCSHGTCYCIPCE